MRPRNDPDNLTVLLDKVKEKFQHLPSKTIDTIIQFKWKDLHRQFSQPHTVDIEDTGIGTFKARYGAISKEIKRYEEKLLHIQEELPKIPQDRVKRLEKYVALSESIPKDINTLKTKLQVYEQRNTKQTVPDNGGVEKSLGSTTFDEGVDTDGSRVQDGGL